MGKQITIGDVAEALGVSKTTVSRAISGKGRIGQDTRDKILEYIEKHDYKPNIMAQGLANSRTYNIGVVMPGDYELVDLPFFLNCLEGLHDVASSNGYDMVFSMCTNTNLTDLERILNNGKVDGVVLMRTFVKDRAVRLLSEKALPFVTIGSSTVPQVIQVDQNHEEGCCELTSILLMKGMKRMALIGGTEEYIVTQKRLQGYLKAFSQQKITVARDLIYQNQENSVMIEHTVEELLQKKIECIVCMDDNICRCVLDKLKKEHVRVPEDVKVASFFNSMVLENNSPSITSLSFDSKELGMVAARILIDQITGREVKEKTLLGYNVVLRESTK